MTIGIVAGIVVVVLIAWFISMYNGLVKLRNNRENAFANIDVQLKQRFDLVPQLVSTVKGYATHEKETLDKVTSARAAAMNATTVDEKVQADKALSGALAGLRISLEAYPELKANQNFLQLQNELADIENKLSAARRFFNSTTRRHVRFQARSHVRGYRRPRNAQQSSRNKVLRQWGANAFNEIRRPSNPNLAEQPQQCFAVVHVPPYYFGNDFCDDCHYGLFRGTLPFDAEWLPR